MPNIRQAVAAKDTAATAAPAQVSETKSIATLIDQYKPVIGALLQGTNVTPEKYRALVANACRAVPKLYGCVPETVLGAALRCAQLGLAPNDPRSLAWILPYDRRENGRVVASEAQFQLGYGGVLELARRAVPGLRFDGRPVYPNDEFDIDFGRDQPLVHRPGVVLGHTDRGGDAFAWYVRALYPDGSVQVHVLDRQGVEYHRSFSKQPDGQMWSKSYDAAALKSVVMDMRRWLPSSAELSLAIEADESTVRVEEVQPIEATYRTDDDPALPEPQPVDTTATESEPT